MKKLLTSFVAFCAAFMLLNPIVNDAHRVQALEANQINLQATPHQVGDWTVNGTFAINAPTSVIKGNNEYIAIGNYGTVMKSKDGVNWTTLTRFENYQLTSIAWTGNSYVLAGANTQYSDDAIYTPASIFVSKDGLSWEESSYHFDDSIQYMEYGQHIVVASGRHGLYTSKDGMSWEKAVDFGDSYRYHPLQYVNGQFFVNVYEKNELLTSKDGVKWTKHKLDTNANIENMIYYNGQYVGIGYGDGIYKSTDGVKWSKLSSSPSNVMFRSIAANGTQVVAMGTGGTDTEQVVYTSNTLSTWTKQDLKSLGHQYYAIYAVQDGFAGIGFSQNSSIYAMSSKNGLNWTHKLIGSSSFVDLEGIAFSGKRLVAVGGLGNIIYSDNGTNWHSSHPLANRDRIGRPYFNDVAYGANKFVAVGNAGVYTSKDGYSWSKSTSFSNTDTMLSQVIWTGTYFIASGQGDGVYYSKDGVSWSKVSSVSKEGQWLMSMTFDGKNIVAGFQMYNNGNQYIQMMQTTDGKNWTKLTTFQTMSIEITYNNGTYLAIDPYFPSNIWLSKDAKTWTKTSIPADMKNEALPFVQSYDNHFVLFNSSLVVENGSYYKKTYYYTSVDGKSWKKHEVPVRQTSEIFGNETLKDGIKAFGRYIFVGSQGYILSTTDLQLSDPIYITVNQTEIKQSITLGKAYIENGTTYLPLRVIGEALQFQVMWNNDTKSVTFKNKSQSATFSDIKIKDGKSYVALRKVSEQLGYTVAFEKKNNAIYIDIKSTK